MVRRVRRQYDAVAGAKSGYGTHNPTRFWGENGYFRIKRGSNECGIEEQAVANSASAKWGKKK
jgi:hypothetical protein